MKKYLPSLNGLRAISIFIVAFNHLRDNHFLSDNIFLKYLGIFLFNGALGVGIFFIISGFLITTLLIEEQNAYGSISLRNFYIRRVIRIFPAYYFLLLVCFFFQKINYLESSGLSWATVITFTKQFYRKGPPELGPLWSLSVEEFFYLLWPYIFIRFKDKLLPLVSLLIAAIALNRLILTNLPQYNFSKTIFTVGDALLIGCVAAIKFDEISSFVKQRPAIIYVLFFALLSFIYLDNFIFVNAYKEGNIKMLSPSLIWRALSALSSSLLGNTGLLTNICVVLIIIYSIVSRGLWFKVLNLPIMNHIGKLSYSIYLYFAFFTSDRPNLHTAPLLILLLCTYVVAVISYNLIEKPFFKFRKYFSGHLSKSYQEPAISS